MQCLCNKSYFLIMCGISFIISPLVCIRKNRFFRIVLEWGINGWLFRLFLMVEMILEMQKESFLISIFQFSMEFCQKYGIPTANLRFDPKFHFKFHSETQIWLKIGSKFIKKFQNLLFVWIICQKLKYPSKTPNTQNIPLKFHSEIFIITLNIWSLQSTDQFRYKILNFLQNWEFWMNFLDSHETWSKFKSFCKATPTIP